MKHFAALVSIAVALLATSAFAVNREKQAYLLDEVLRLSHEGVPDRLILKQIEAMDFAFELTADDIVELRTLGVSDDILEALIDTRLREREADDDLYVRVSAGYYSPWYQFPYAWGFYYDPFPSCYSYYYYPFHYSSHHLGWYGWCGNSYYYTYNWYERPYAHHDRDYRRYRNREPDNGYRLAGHVPSDVAQVPVRAVRETPAGSGIAPERVRTRERAAEPRTRTIATRVDRPTLQTPRTPYRADRVSSPPRGRAVSNRSGRNLQGLRAPISTPDRQRAEPADPVVREPEASRQAEAVGREGAVTRRAEPVVREPQASPVRRRDTKSPALHERRAATVTPPVRSSDRAPWTGSAPWARVLPERTSQPAAPMVRSQPSGMGGSRGHAIPSAPASGGPRGISRGKVR
jgi:hypothetical protein